MHDNRRVPPRFYAPDMTSDAVFRLSAEESHHLTRVLRLTPGAVIELFDGRGALWRAEVVEASREQVRVRCVERLPVPATPRHAITVVLAVLKGSSMDDVVRDATMIGASAIEPVMTDHVTVKTSQVMRDETRDRWDRIALAAAKQSRRITLPPITAVRTFEAWLSGPHRAPALIFVEPTAGVRGRSLRSLEAVAESTTLAVLLGPEGGWSPRELTAAVEAGCVPVSLGPMTLRAESMVVAAIAAVRGAWGD